MSAIELAPELVQDFSRILAHLAAFEVRSPDTRLLEIVAGLDVLESNPMIGRPTAGDLRELVIGRDARGYVALYRYVQEIDTVFVLAIRSQREAGYRE
ncbi:plasmid stabilization system family protein [Methyloversatilis sp. RAC08]|uniref:type II toxin-antitoxin system RelE/ParE family toxin n=1 Tax=Methyloversatilis sp. RAC08 TaxID=1842540 RepID=UPI00083E0728|nr:type II toxin-antitoxin system RelE/ParE family toxin [Methyloversatilis sp. RAC08]AOF81899.1 plasmid stabilization system family protein [Methyloversatilis sp. RAC08]